MSSNLSRRRFLTGLGAGAGAGALGIAAAGDAGAIGLELLSEDAWKDESSIEFLADYNAQPPLGIGGLDAMDKGKERHGKRSFGALGIGGLKLKLHRACVGQLFDNTEQVLDAEEIYALAKKMA